MFERLIPNAAASYQFNNGTDIQQSEVADKMGFVTDMISKMTEEKSFTHSPCTLNIFGYIPVVSTVSGSYRTLVGLAYLVKSATCYFFDQTKRTKHLEGLKIAAANIGRGVLEIIPVVGNLFALNIDVSRALQRWTERSNAPYGDYKTIPIISNIDQIGIFPIIGTVTNLARALFCSIHTLVNIPPAMTGNRKYWEAVKFGASQVAIGLIESIPLVGNAHAFFRCLTRSSLFNKKFVLT